MRILVLGGTRFIGLALVERLAADGHDVAVVHRGRLLGGAAAELPPGVEEFLVDRSDIDGASDQLLDWRPEAVVDMFAMTEASARAALGALTRGPVRRWIVASSLDVYRAYDHLQRRESGPPLEGPLTEDSPLRQHLYPYRGTGRDAGFAIDDYEKIEVEQAVLGWPDIEPVVLRLPAVYGPRDAQHRLARDLERMDRGDEAIELGASEAGWRFAMGYVEDVAHALALAATQEHARGVYVVAEPETRTRLELLNALAEEAGWGGRIEVRPDKEVADAPIDFRQHMAADSSRIRRELGYAEQVPFREALRRTIEWERAQRGNTGP
jgi:nucleoside-diphosphate-sugar epimerase